MKKCLIFLEKEYETFAIDLLQTAREMYGDSFESYGVSFHADQNKAIGKFDKLITVDAENIHDYDLKNTNINKNRK